MNAPENWYIYYPAPSSGGPTLQQLRAMQEGLSRSSAVRTRLEERVGTDAAPTWMEVYEGVTNPSDFAATLTAAVERFGLRPEELAARHLERFRLL